MNFAFAVPGNWFSSVEKREAAFWAVGAIVALILHIAVALFLFLIRPAGEAIGSPVAMMVEISALPSASATESETLKSDDVRPEETKPAENTPKPVEETEPEPETKEAEPEPVEEAEPEPEPVKEVVPEPAHVQTPDVAIPVPQPRPVIQPRPAAERRQARQQQRDPAVPVEIARAQPFPAPEGRTNRTQAARQGADGVSPASWRNQLQAWVQRHKSYPSASAPMREAGTVELKFTIDTEGNVTSSRVSRSSGSPRLDRAALDMLRRASPVPPPPRSFNTATMVLSMPVTFEYPN